MLQAHVLATSVFQLEYAINHFPGSNIRAVLNITEAVLWFRILRLSCLQAFCLPHPCNSHGLVLEFAASSTYSVSAIICITAARAPDNAFAFFNARSPRLSKRVQVSFTPRFDRVYLNAFSPRVHPVQNANALYLVSGRYCIINPRRACAARVTVVVLCVCLSVCLSVCQHLFSHYRLRGGL